MAVTVYFVRHGQTYLNEYRRMQGWADTPLTEKGRRDAALAGQALASVDFDQLLSSDLKRAEDTAKILLAHHPSKKVKVPMADPAFREVFFGYFEGLSVEQTSLMASAPEGLTTIGDIIDEHGADYMLQSIHDADPYHQAENPDAFWHRYLAGLEGLRRLPDGQVAVVVSHGLAINCLANRYNTSDHRLVGPDNGSITKFTLTPNSTKLEFFNRKTLPNDWGGNSLVHG